MLLKFNVAHGFSEAIFGAKMLLIRIGYLGEQSTLLVVVVRFLVVHDNCIRAIHLLVNEVTIESKLFSTDNVGAGVEWLAHLLLFFSLQIYWLLAGIVPSIATSPLGPIHKVHELLDIL